MIGKSILFGCSVTARQHSYQDLLNLTYGVDLSPQACVLNTSIRHTVIAIAALSMISKGHHEANLFHQFALRQYSKGLLQMRTAISNGSHDLRTALMDSIVLVSFEPFYGSHDSELGQLGVGLALLKG